MNYIKLYSDFMTYCKSVNILDRLRKRDQNDFRIELPYDDIYKESHHIVPRHNRGSNNFENLVVLLPEEHFLAHLIRYKAYGQREDMLACRFIMNGIVGKNLPIPSKITSKIVAKFKQSVYAFRKSNSWHTEDGLKRISVARRRKTVARCTTTGAIVGVVASDDVRFKTGELVHHSKGRSVMINVNTGQTARVPFDDVENYIKTGEWVKKVRPMGGIQNVNYSNLAAEDLYFKFYEYYSQLTDKSEASMTDFRNQSRLNGVSVPAGMFKSFRFPWVEYVNRSKRFEKFALEVCIKFDLDFEVVMGYINSRSQKHKDALSKSGTSDETSYVWVCSSESFIRVRKRDLQPYLDKGFKRGRKW